MSRKPDVPALDRESLAAALRVALDEDAWKAPWVWNYLKANFPAESEEWLALADRVLAALRDTGTSLNPESQ